MIQRSQEFAVMRRLYEAAKGTGTRMNYAAREQINSDNEVLSAPEQRIFAQMQFVCTLSNDGRYDDILEAAEQYLTDCYRRCGALTNDHVAEAEKILAPAAKEAKSYEYICAAHGHIDMNWMWGYHQTAGVVMDTFRTMLNLMNEFPDFKYSQSQASVYQILEEYDPDMLDEIRQRIHEGRWEVTASTWVETDSNMPNGESAARHLINTRAYLKKLLGLKDEDFFIDFEPDTFGHMANLPEILSNNGIHCFYHCRGHRGDHILQRWQSPSGAEVMLYTEPIWYNACIDYHVADFAADIARITGSKTILKVYGVGDHGGGPTRLDLQRLTEMNDWPVYPQFRFGTFREYFEAVSGLRSQLPVVKGEINFLCDGCYTTQSRIKAGNRETERLLYQAEADSAAAELTGAYRAPIQRLDRAWENVLFNQFHDILTGSGVIETREYASGLYQKSIAAAQGTIKQARRSICERIDTEKMLGVRAMASFSEGAGAGFGDCNRCGGNVRGYVIFNEQPYARKEVVEITLWDFDADMRRLQVTDSEGNVLPHQLLGSVTDYWSHRYQKIAVEATVPAMGYAAIRVGMTDDLSTKVHFINDMRCQTTDEFVLENDFLCARFSDEDASLISVKNKKTGKEYIGAEAGAQFIVATEAGVKSVTGWENGMSAWFVGRRKKVQSAHEQVEIRPLHEGKLRNGIEFESKFGASSLKVQVWLDQDSPVLKYKAVCDWREFGSENNIPGLYFRVPCADSCGEYLYDIPFGFAKRNAVNMDLPGNTFAAAHQADGVALMAHSTYGYRCRNNALEVALIRSGCDPDPIPEICVHEIELGIAFGVDGTDGVQVKRLSDCVNQPMSAMSVDSHGGALAAKHSYLSAEENGVLISSVKMAQDGSGDLILRLYEAHGVDEEALIQLDFTAKKAWMTDVYEQPADGQITVKENAIAVHVPAYRIATVRIQKV